MPGNSLMRFSPASTGRICTQYFSRNRPAKINSRESGENETIAHSTSTSFSNSGALNFRPVSDPEISARGLAFFAGHESRYDSPVDGNERAFCSRPERLERMGRTELEQTNLILCTRQHARPISVDCQLHHLGIIRITPSIGDIFQESSFFGAAMEIATPQITVNTTDKRLKVTFIIRQTPTRLKRGER
jgi:hypothetical protein